MVNYMPFETAIVLATRPRTQQGNVRLTHAIVDRKDWPLFRTRFQCSRVNEKTITTDEAGNSLRIPDLHEVWRRLENEPVLNDITERIARGIEWNVPIDENRDDLISARPRPGFARGIASKAEGFSAFQEPASQFLCTQQKYRRGNAFDLPWSRSKTVINAKRRRRGRWRITAFADVTGLICYQTFTCIWPAHGWSATVIAAILNGPVANCFVSAHENSRDITNETLRRIPVPRSEHLDSTRIEQLVEEYIRCFDQLPLANCLAERLASDVLNEIDELTLDGYKLGLVDARRIREYLSGSERPIPAEASIGGWWLRSPEKFKIEFRPSADAVLRALNPTDRSVLRSAIAKLEGGPRFADMEVQLIPGSQELFVCTATDDLRVIFLARPDRTILIQDIVNKEIIKQYFEVEN